MYKKCMYMYMHTLRSICVYIRMYVCMYKYNIYIYTCTRVVILIQISQVKQYVSSRLIAHH